MRTAQCSRAIFSTSRIRAPWSRILSTMSLTPCSSRSLFPLLAFLLLLTLPQHLAEGNPTSIRVATELRCVCLSVTPRINPKMIVNLEVIAAGPQCPRVEVIAKLKNQKEVCLDPEAPLMKKIIQKILDSGNKKTKTNAVASEKSFSDQ